MDSLAALVADRNGDKHDPIEVADFLDAMGDRSDMVTGEAMHDAADVVRGLAAALRPYLAPAGLEAFEGLRRREHTPKCRLYYASGGATKDRDRCHPVDCGADAHNARVDAARAAHAAALAEMEGLRRELAAANPEPLAEVTTLIHPDQGDGPYIELSARVAVPRGTPGSRARVVALPE